MPAEPPSRPVLRERFEHRMDIVVSHAAREFATRGFDATSIQDLLTATGLTAGGLYHYIGSKDELLVRICDQLMEPLLGEVREIVASDLSPRQQLLEIVHVWMEVMERKRYHVVVFGQERHVLERDARWDAVRHQRKDFERLLAEVLERGERAGEFSFADRDLALRALLGMVNHTAQWFREDGRLTAEEIADGYVELLLGSAPA